MNPSSFNVSTRTLSKTVRGKMGHREQLSSLEGAHKIEITRANAAEAKAMALAESVKKEEPDLPLESNKAEGQNLLQVNALIEETKLLRSQLEDYERAHVSLTQKLEKEAAEGLTARQKNTRDLSLIQSLGSKIEEQAAALQAEEGKLAYIKIQLFQAQKSLGDRDKENAVLLQSVEEKDNLKNLTGFKLCVELRTNLKKAHSDNEKLSKSCNVQAEEIESLKAQLSSMKEKRDRKESRQEQRCRHFALIKHQDEKIQELESHAEKLAKENSEAVQEKRRLQSAIIQMRYRYRKFDLKAATLTPSDIATSMSIVE
ncbi:hypothetical protein H0H93_011973 [Arthromyces matolae]|nr:hypothetical protein H0H93_011973 [Arthromyces matolae]